MTKYRNEPRMYDGILFDSKLEARRYAILSTAEQNGQIENLEIQPKFELQERFRLNGKWVRAITYKADFSYWQGGIRYVEDTKGVETAAFKIKKKLLIYRYLYLEKSNFVFRLIKNPLEAIGADYDSTN